MYFDGSFTVNGAGGVIVLISPIGDRLHFRATNNVAEYVALVNGLRIATELGVHRLYIHGDSELIVNPVMGELNYCESHTVAYRQEVRRLEENFDGFELHHILR
jgi:ribonuclease HI